MSTYTESLGLELITPGSQAGLWGTTTNNTFNLIDQAITGVTPLSFASASGTTITLTDYNGAQDEARSAVLNITGTATGANTVVIPNKQKTYLVRNNTGQNVTFQTPSPSATYAVEAGYSILIFCDGNNNVFTGIAAPSVGTLSVSGGGTGSTSFGSGGFIKSSGTTNALTASSTVNAATELSGVTPVANGGTGKSSLVSGALLYGQGTGAIGEFVGTASGQVATWNGLGWAATTPTSSGITSISAGTGITVNGGTGPVTSGAVTIAATSAGTVTSVGLSVPTGLSVANSPVTTSGTIVMSYASGYSIPTTISQTNWDSAYSQRLQWDGGSTNLNASTGRTSLGLGTMATQNTTSYVPITGGTFTGDVVSSTTFRAPILSAGGSSSTNSVNIGASGIGSAVNYYAPAVGNSWTSIYYSATSSALGNQYYVMTFNDGTSTQYSGYTFNGAGNASAVHGSWVDSSDVRIKENITPVATGLDKISQLNPVMYSYKKDALSAPNKYGLIAQELEQVIPEVVFLNSGLIDGIEDLRTVAYTNLIPILIKAVQELKAEVDALKAAQ